MRAGALLLALAAGGAFACSRSDSDRPVSRAEAPPSVAPATLASASAAVAASAAAAAAVGDAGPRDWINPEPCVLGDVPQTTYEPYVGLKAFIAAYDEVKAKCGTGDTHGQGRVTVVLGGKCGGVRSLKFAEGPVRAGTPTGECVLDAFKKIKVHPFLGDDLEITKTFIVP